MFNHLSTIFPTNCTSFIQYNYSFGNPFKYFASMELRMCHQYPELNCVLKTFASIEASDLKTWNPLIQVMDLTQALKVSDMSSLSIMHLCDWFTGNCKSAVWFNAVWSEKETLELGFQQFLESALSRYNTNYTAQIAALIATGVLTSCVVLKCIHKLRQKCARRDDIEQEARLQVEEPLLQNM